MRLERMIICRLVGLAFSFYEYHCFPRFSLFVALWLAVARPRKKAHLSVNLVGYAIGGIGYSSTKKVQENSGALCGYYSAGIAYDSPKGKFNEFLSGVFVRFYFNMYFFVMCMAIPSVY